MPAAVKPATDVVAVIVVDVKLATVATVELVISGFNVFPTIEAFKL